MVEMRQNLKQSQTQTLSPQIQQFMKMLPLTHQELQTLVIEELRENPCLEEEEFSERELSAGEESKEYTENSSDGMGQLEHEIEQSLGFDGHDDFRTATDVIERFRDSVSSGQNNDTWSESGDLDQDVFLRFNHESPTSLHEAIQEQLHLMDLLPEELTHCEVIVEYLDSTGFLAVPLTQIAENHQLVQRELAHALAVVQRCDPAGVGASTTQEALLLQLARLDKTPKHVEQIIRECWHEVEKHELNKIARSLSIDQQEVKTALSFIIDHLDPKPARQYDDGVNYAIIPDIFVFKRDDKWIVSVNQEGLPRLKLTNEYQGILDGLTGKRGMTQDKVELRAFLSEKIKNARWLIHALSERNQTVLRVGEEIVRRQEAFFEHGIEHLKPLTLKDIAEVLGLHESTISRATTNKFLDSPQGILELKYFFSGGYSHGEGPANETVKQWVAEYIKKEDPEAVLSDQDLSELIGKEKGLKLARRTVAKYRESLGLLTSSQRSRLYQTRR